MSTLSNLAPQRVFYYFEEISKIPRGSGNTRAISDYLVEFANSHNLEVYRDDLNNVIIKKEATADKANCKGVILQGHMDMVCEKTLESTHDFLKDGLELEINGDFITANGTTLGADDGVAVAISLAILEDNYISHPKIEAIFTVDEETGMDGAKFIDLSGITGQYVLNLDCEMEDTIIAGCAGGARIDVVFKGAKALFNGTKIDIDIFGLLGGHSGSDIDKQRANAHILLGRILHIIRENMDIGILSIEGGTKDNVIANVVKSSIIVPVGKAENAIDIINRSAADIVEEYKFIEDNIHIQGKVSENGIYNVIDEDAANDLIFFMGVVPNGIIDYNANIKDLVETSLNMGVLSIKDYTVSIGISVRSQVKSKKEKLVGQIIMLAQRANADYNVRGVYPAWSYTHNSPLQKLMKEIYLDKFHRELKTEIIHAGLECGYLLEKLPHLDIVSFGPLMYDIHTVNERLSISSTKKIYQFILEILKNIE